MSVIYLMIDETITIHYKNIYFLKGSKLWKSERDRYWRRTQHAEDCYIDPYLLSNIVFLYSGPCLALLFLSWEGHYPLSLDTSRLLPGVPRTSWIPKSILTTDCKTDCICHWWLHIWFHNHYIFPVNPSCHQPTYLLQAVYTDASCSGNPGLTALSKVNNNAWPKYILRKKEIYIYIYIYI